MARCSAHDIASSDSALSSTISEYARASCEYQNSSGLIAVSSAAIKPTRPDASRRPAAHMTGIVAVPHRAESDRRPASPVPNTRDHSHAST